MRYILSCCLLLIGLTLSGQNVLLVNSGSNTGSNQATNGRQTVYFSMGNPTMVVPMRAEKQLVHHGFEYPVLLRKGKKFSNFQAAPNPTQGVVNLSGVFPSDAVVGLQVTDALGRILLAAPYTNSLDLSPYSNGMYYLTLSVDGHPESVHPIILSR